MRTKALLGFVLTAVWTGLLGDVPARSLGIHGNTKTTRPVSKEVYTGRAIGIGGELGHVSIPFTLEVDGQTPDQDIQQDKQILESKGQLELLKAINKTKLGTFTFEGQPAHDVNFVQEQKEDKGLSVTLLFEYWPRLFEVSKKTKFEDYPFTFVQFFVNDNGKGDGSMITAAKITLKNNVADTDDYGSFPAHLMNVQLQK